MLNPGLVLMVTGLTRPSFCKSPLGLILVILWVLTLTWMKGELAL
jgi:hypothetical protein